MRRLVAVVCTLTSLALAASPAAVQAAPATAAPTSHAEVHKPTVGEKRVIGRSVRGRKIWAYRLGEPARRGVPTVVLMSTMHGNESDTRHLLLGLKAGAPVRGVDLWLVPTYNPDGLARGTRRNAHGVDLNRNFPYKWRDLDGNYESGRGPASEPETRAMMRFLRQVRPNRILSFHQPLHGVDTDTKRPAFARRVAKALRLPTTRLDCGNVCHGTMTMWFNHAFPGAALTVEYGAHPDRRYLSGTASGQVLRIFGARRTSR